MIKCSNCNEDFEVNQPGHFILEYTGIKDNRNHDCDIICSLACLTEWAWKLRDAQPKLSKSQIHTCKICGPECQCG